MNDIKHMLGIVNKIIIYIIGILMHIDIYRQYVLPTNVLDTDESLVQVDRNCLYEAKPIWQYLIPLVKVL